MRRYAIVIEDAGGNFSGYVPDLPLCVATDDTSDAVVDLLREAIDFYLESLIEDGVPLPDSPPTAPTRVVDTAG